MIQKTLKYFVLLTLILYGLRALHFKGLLKQEQGYYGKYNQIFFSVNHFNTLILGSSRAEMHYDPVLIDHLTGWNTFNLSMAGAGTEAAYRLLKLYLVNSKVPERIFYEADLNFLYQDKEDLYRFNNFFPYLGNRNIRENLSHLEPRLPCFHWIAYYSWPYTGWDNLNSSLRSWFRLPLPEGEHYTKGFLPGPVKGELPYEPIVKENTSLSDHHRQFLDSLQLLCNSRGIELHILSSPIFAGGRISLENKEELVRTLKEQALKHKQRYHDLSSLPFCHRRELFLDTYHMNATGAALYSHYFVNYFYTKSHAQALN